MNNLYSSSSCSFNIKLRLNSVLPPNSSSCSSCSSAATFPGEKQQLGSIFTNHRWKFPDEDTNPKTFLQSGRRRRKNQIRAEIVATKRPECVLRSGGKLAEVLGVPQTGCCCLDGEEEEDEEEEEEVDCFTAPLLPLQVAQHPQEI